MGQALMDGSEGELIRVRNSSSKQIVTGTVTGDGTVDVHL
jgi:flagella basal body P-ring formation protein FlgA